MRVDAYANADPSKADLYSTTAFHELFRHLRQHEPIHYCEQSAHGPYWSITRHEDIIAIERDTATFSSDTDFGGFLIFDESGLGFSGYAKTFIENSRPFQGVDGKEHSDRRRKLAPGFSGERLGRFQIAVERYVNEILDAVPSNKPFDWLNQVALDLPLRSLSYLLGLPQEERFDLAELSDAMAGLWIGDHGYADQAPANRASEIVEKAARTFLARRGVPPEGEETLLTLMSDNNLNDFDYFNDIILLVVGGIGTTMTSIAACALAMASFPDQFERIRQDDGLLSGAVSEIIRWETPLFHMRRTALSQVEVRGKTINKGDAVVLWYASGNRDEAVFDEPEKFLIDRARAKQHLSFGAGIHRCIGFRVAELQVKTLLKSMLSRYQRLEVVGRPEKIPSCFVNGFSGVEVIASERR